MIKRKFTINIGEERCSNKVRYETKEDALTSYKNYRLMNRGKRGESKIDKNTTSVHINADTVKVGI